MKITTTLREWAASAAGYNDRIEALRLALACEARDKVQAQAMLERASAQLRAAKEELEELHKSHDALKRGVDTYAAWLGHNFPFKGITETIPVREMFKRWVRY